MSNRIELVRRYLAAMEAGDLESTLACFTADAVVLSPIYGAVAARPFYEKLFADTIRVQLDIGGIYVADGMPDMLIAHFGYVWERRDQPPVDTSLVDFFELDPGDGRIARLRILFDDGQRDDGASLR